MKSSTTWNANLCHCAITKRNVSSVSGYLKHLIYIQLIQVLSNDHLCNCLFIYHLLLVRSFSFFTQTFHHNGSTVFGEMCHGCPDVNTPRGTDAPILGQYRSFMSIKLQVQAQ